MTTIELEKQIKSGNMHGIYLLYGDNSFLKDTNLKKIKKNFCELVQGINFITIDENGINNLISDIQTPAFGYDYKLIIVKNSNLFKKESKAKKTKTSDIQNKINEYIAENIDEINESVLLIFYEESVEKNQLFQTIEKLGNICNFENLKNNDLIKSLKSVCNAYKVNISDECLKKFVELVGNDMQECINEIRKLIEYAGTNGTITSNEIDLLTIKKIEAIIFDLTDSLGTKDTGKAIQVLNDLLYNKEPIQKILITLYNHFKKLYIVTLASKYNKSIEESLNLKPNQAFLISKYRKQANYFTEEILRNLLRELYLLDVNYKQGKIDLNIGLESILCSYCSR